MAAKYSDTITMKSGSVIPGATIQVLDGAGALMTLYSDAALTESLGTSAVSDDNGLVEFYIADGTYTIVQTSGSASISLLNVELYDISTLAVDVQALETATDLRPTYAALDLPQGYPSFTDDITNFLSTTTATTASTPNTNQRPLYIPKGVWDGGTNATITATGAAQVVFGDGNNSQLTDASLKWVDFDYGGAHGLYLRGTSDYGVTLESAGSGETLRYPKFSNLLIRGKGKAFNITSPAQNAVASVQATNIDMIGNTEGLYHVGGANLDYVNLQSVANQRNSYLYGIAELKILNGRFQGATAGPSFEIYGDATRASLESYFVNNNFNEGSATDDVAITNIAGYAGGTQIEVTCAAAHKMAPGFAKVIISGTTNYNNTWTVADVTSSTVMILQIGSAAEAAGTYTVTETSGTFNRHYPGLYAHASSMAAAAYVNDLYFYGGSSNNTHLENVYDVVMAMRGFGGKERTWVDNVNRVLFFGSGRGRDGLNTYADVLPSGSATGYAMMGVFDPTATLAPGGQRTGMLAPWASLGLAANNRPAGYFGMFVAEDGIELCADAYSSSMKKWKLKRAGLSNIQYVTADDGFRVTSDDRTNGFEAIGGTTGNNPVLKPYGGDTNIGLSIEGKGTGAVNLGPSATRIRVNSVGAAFFNGTPVAKPTGVAVDIAAVHAALVTLNLIAA